MKYKYCLICGMELEWSGRKLKHKGVICPDCSELVREEVNKVYHFFHKDFGQFFGGKLRKEIMITEWNRIIEMGKKML